MKKVLLFIFIGAMLLSLAATYYRYVVLKDFSYETKPLDEFTEEDF